MFTVSVRELVEFVSRRGDLGGSREFVGADRALAGTRGHQRIQRSRPEGYRKEVPVSREVEGGEWVLRIQGRVDGVLVTDDGVVIEEIKTVRGGWDGVADPLHWAQARLYAFIHAANEAIEAIEVQLVYLDLDTGEVTEFRERSTRVELGACFDAIVGVYLEWVRELHHWRLTRDRSIRSLGFPFVRYRSGQRRIAVAVYRTLSCGGRLYLEAPTGIGKTVSVLFAAVKALGEGKLGRIFYLTARTVGRAVAEQAMVELRAAGLRLRSVTLTAREKVCVQKGKPCDPADCPLARGYYDRRHAAMRDALGRESLTRIELEAVSHAHGVCPFELSLDVSMWVDAIVCDYNYVFDPRVYLRRHFADGRGTGCFLIDEAHNLVDRSRDMFSADLSCQEIRVVRRAVRKVLPGCAKALNRLDAILKQLAGRSGASSEPKEPIEAGGELSLFASTIDAAVMAPTAKFARIRPLTAARDIGSLTRREPPIELRAPLDVALRELETWLARNRPAEFRDDLLELYFRLHAFRRTAELYDERYVTIVETGDSIRIRLFCLDPSVLIRQALDRGRSAVFFSATLTPTDYYTALLGGDIEDPQLRMGSPFDSARLAVLVHDRVRTQLKERSGSLLEVVRGIGAMVEGRPGNYMVYFPSYQYLATALDRFKQLYPHVMVHAQQPRMAEPEREAFLAAFSDEPANTQVGFAVMGGVFGEGIDLAGDRLIGAAIVGVGLPQLCVERDLIRDHFQARTGAGFNYAYAFPGMNRVLQAVGRVIRSETDRGVVLMFDTRFAEPRYRRLFPTWWQAARVENAEDVRTAIRAFWGQSV